MNKIYLRNFNCRDLLNILVSFSKLLTTHYHGHVIISTFYENLKTNIIDMLFIKNTAVNFIFCTI